MANKGLLKVWLIKVSSDLPKVSWGLELGADLIGAAPTINSSLPGLISEITMKPGEIDRRFKGFHL